jgi:hypothetical protein
MSLDIDESDLDFGNPSGIAGCFCFREQSGPFCGSRQDDFEQSFRPGRGFLGDSTDSHSAADGNRT